MSRVRLPCQMSLSRIVGIATHLSLAASRVVLLEVPLPAAADAKEDGAIGWSVGWCFEEQMLHEGEFGDREIDCFEMDPGISRRGIAEGSCRWC